MVADLSAATALIGCEIRTYIYTGQPEEWMTYLGPLEHEAYQFTAQRAKMASLTKDDIFAALNEAALKAEQDFPWAADRVRAYAREVDIQELLDKITGNQDKEQSE
jgi:hypothetical protein